MANIHIGLRIRDLLEKKNITQAELGRILGKKPQGISSLLSQKQTRTDTLFDLCESMDIGLEELVPEYVRTKQTTQEGGTEAVQKANDLAYRMSEQYERTIARLEEELARYTRGDDLNNSL